MLISAAAKAVEALYNATANPGQLQIQATRKDFDGDRTLVVFPLLKLSKKAPEATGEEIGAWMVANVAEVTAFNVVKGFLNLSIGDAYWIGQLNTALAAEKFGWAEPSGKTMMLEYSSPNTNKPLHLGHVRNNLLGYSVSRILEANGHKVVKVQIVNDRGIHICKSMLAWQRYGEGETPESSGIKGDHLVGKYYVRFNDAYKAEMAELVAGGMDAKLAEKEAPILKDAQEMLRQWEANDPEVTELWKTMNGWVYSGFDETYHAMGVSFDKLYYESNTYLLGKDQVQRGLAGGQFTQREDGSVWVDLTSEGLDQKLVQRSDGTAVYMTQDIGTAILRSEDYPAASSFIYTVGNEQDYHFKVLFLILKKLGYEWAEQCHHLSYGMVELPTGKMKSREGTVVDADELMESMVEIAREASEERAGDNSADPTSEDEDLYNMVGLGALKYFILKVDPKRKMLFDPAESIALTGNTGPFIQYTHARIQSILRNEGGTSNTVELPADGITSMERDLIKDLYHFPEVVREAGEHMAPALIANHVFALAQGFNTFYQTSQPRIKDDADATRKAFRLGLAALVGRVIKTGMDCLGIQVPDRM